MESDGFTVVRKGKKHRSKTNRTTIIDCSEREVVDIQNCIKKVNLAVNDLEISNFFDQICSVCRSLDVKELWCFGLGHVGHCITARFQFALLLLLRDTLNLESKDVFLCDPIFLFPLKRHEQ